MTSVNLFRCSICDAPIGNPHLCLDRRIEKLGVMNHADKPSTRVDISNRETLLIYCSPDCWQLNQPGLAAALELKKTFPAFGFVTPCCRCGKPVNRTKPYVCFSISEMKLEGTDVIIAQCLDDLDFAVLCRKCDAPDSPEAETSADITHNNEEGELV